MDTNGHEFMRMLLDWIAVHWVLALVMLCIMSGTVIGVAAVVSEAIAGVIIALGGAMRERKE